MATRWGSLLSQAVAGVESRLDNILAEGDDAGAGGGGGAGGQGSGSPAVGGKKSAGQPVNARASSSTRANDRLQARLAKAVASKAAGSPRTGSPRSSSDLGARASAERTRAMAPTDREGKGASADAEVKADVEAEAEAKAKTSTEGMEEAEIIASTETSQILETLQATTGLDESTAVPSSDSRATGDSIDESAAERPSEAGTQISQAVLADEPEKEIGNRELEEWKALHQAEIQEYVERIDSLQSKLQYMSRNAADAAKKTASSAAAGSVERKLAEQEERVALLMEEGQKLAGAEQQYRATIKKLRLQLVDKDKQLVNVEHEKAKAVSEAATLRGRLSSDEGREKRQQETLKATAALQKEIDALKRDKQGKDETIRRLEQEAKLKLEQAAVTHADALKRAISAEEEKQKELKSQKTSLAAELENFKERARQEEIDWGEKLERAIERGRAVEGELRLELKTMETKLEGIRVAAEEATSSSGGEAQVKLLRQIETLQSQYASARENWQGIEASLLAKTGGLEKEKDEAQRRESEMRKRARDAASRCRALEDELHDAQPALAAAQKELEACHEQLAELRASSKASEAALEQLRAELDKEKRSTVRELSAEAERRQWAEGVAGSLSRNHSRPASPMLPISRALSSDMIGLPYPGRTSRRIATPGSVSDSPQQTAEGPAARGRRPPPLNQQPVRSATLSTISTTTDSSSLHMSSVSPFGPPADEAPRLMSSPPPPPPSLPLASPSTTTHRENGISIDDAAPSSPRGLAQDMVSVCTVAAGPSVQLVERMSAAIRRLEGDKVTAREEMARVCAQRDEARGDIAALMRELEEARGAADRVPELQRQVDDLDARYQTTLELLGEKSELVDELRADVEDVKAMYRELVERAVK